jgi:hypothetical protein
VQLHVQPLIAPPLPFAVTPPCNSEWFNTKHSTDTHPIRSLFHFYINSDLKSDLKSERKPHSKLCISLFCLQIIEMECIITTETAMKLDICAFTRACILTTYQCSIARNALRSRQTASPNNPKGIWQHTSHWAMTPDPCAPKIQIEAHGPTTWQNCHSQLSVRCPADNTLHCPQQYPRHNRLCPWGCSLLYANWHLYSVFFFWWIFATWRQKKRAGESNKGIFEILKKKSPILTKKNLEVARFGQCVPVGRQN